MGVIKITISTKYPGINDGAPRNLFIILVIAGAGLAVYNSSGLVAGLVGESVGIKEGISSWGNVFNGPRAVLNAKRAIIAAPFKVTRGAISAGKK
jgi:hypothetical protein